MVGQYLRAEGFKASEAKLAMEMLVENPVELAGTGKVK